MDRIFRVDLYPHEFLSLTAHMNPEQKGIFITVCCLIYAHRGPIKNDPAWIGRMANCSPRLVRSILAQLHPIDLQVDLEFVSQKRCESELNSKRTHLQLSAKGGRTRAEIGAESRNIKGEFENRLNTTAGSSTVPRQYKSDKGIEPLPLSGELPFSDDVKFNEFWSGWKPYEMAKGDKPRALKLYNQARKAVEHETLIRTRDQYLANCRNLNCKSKHVATWLNGRGWEQDDALGEITRSGHSGYGHGSTAHKPTALEIALANHPHGR